MRILRKRLMSIECRKALKETHLIMSLLHLLLAPPTLLLVLDLPLCFTIFLQLGERQISAVSHAGGPLNRLPVLLRLLRFGCSDAFMCGTLGGGLDMAVGVAIRLGLGVAVRGGARRASLGEGACM